MHITPAAIREKRFETAARGISPDEVRAFLSEIADALEALVNENASLAKALDDKETEHKRALEREKTLQETLLAAERMLESREHAGKEALPPTQADELAARAQRRLLKIMDDINELKRQRQQFESQMENLLAGHMKLLAATRSSDPQIDVDEAGALLSGVAARSVPPTKASDLKADGRGEADV